MTNEESLLTSLVIAVVVGWGVYCALLAGLEK